MSPELLGWLASILFISRLLPQPVRLVRTGLPEGVSPLASINAVVSESAWLVYGWQAGLVPVWAVSVAALVPGIWTVVLLRHQVTRGDVARAALWLVVIVVAGVTGRLGVVLGVSVLVSVGPQVWTAVREDDLRGLSVFTWLIAIADGLTWGLYGWVVDDGALLGYAAVLVSAALVVLVRMAVTRSPSPAAAGSLTRLRPPSSRRPRGYRRPSAAPSLISRCSPGAHPQRAPSRATRSDVATPVLDPF